MTTAGQLADDIRTELAASADPQRAEQVQAYLKSTLPCYGVPVPRVRLIARRALQGAPDLGRDDWIAAIAALWDGAVHHEECTAAIEIADARRSWAAPDLMPLYRHMAVTGAWWDLVDPLASHLVAEVLRRYPDESATIREWARADDPWLRRVAVLSQVAFGRDTDTDLLRDVLEQNLFDSPFGTGFFIRKAVGWALRAYVPTDAAWVREFVAEHDDRLSTLSRREALRLLD
ncbi:DNA alkylation repair protein [Brooklawnia cerclae]|uniref:3-methyladenine DNA glycosylase AlkD n=1 Tax=Brooklawnia cerclae TaxID=349934 RepID=A0ABX0SLJ7_9ACTN|nr:3-methyladenine DNA glycosylase AlkD [Brooklawnia cerclae]